MFKVRYKAFYSNNNVVEITREYNKMPSVLNRARYAYIWAHSLVKSTSIAVCAIYAITQGQIINARKYSRVKRAKDLRAKQNARDIESLIK